MDVVPIYCLPHHHSEMKEEVERVETEWRSGVGARNSQLFSQSTTRLILIEYRMGNKTKEKTG